MIRAMYSVVGIMLQLRHSICWREIYDLAACRDVAMTGT